MDAHYKPFADLIKERGYKTVVEIGTAYAGNAYHLLQNVQIDRLTCIDPYLFIPLCRGLFARKNTIRCFSSRLIGLTLESRIYMAHDQ